MKKIVKRARKQRGFTLLEYCAGAAVMIGVVYVAMNTLGGNLSSLLTSLSTWASKRNEVINDINQKPN